MVEGKCGRGGRWKAYGVERCQIAGESSCLSKRKLQIFRLTSQDFFAEPVLACFGSADHCGEQVMRAFDAGWGALSGKRSAIHHERSSRYSSVDWNASG